MTGTGTYISKLPSYGLYIFPFPFKTVQLISEFLKKKNAAKRSDSLLPLHLFQLFFRPSTNTWWVRRIIAFFYKSALYIHGAMFPFAKNSLVSSEQVHEPSSKPIQREGWDNLWVNQINVKNTPKMYTNRNSKQSCHFHYRRRHHCSNSPIRNKSECQASLHSLPMLQYCANSLGLVFICCQHR
jgi:hypothetical protein